MKGRVEPSIETSLRPYKSLCNRLSTDLFFDKGKGVGGAQDLVQYNAISGKLHHFKLGVGWV